MQKCLPLRLVMVLGVLGLFFVHAALAQEATRNAEQWREDLRLLATELPRRHIRPFTTISREQWNAEVAALEAAIPTLPDHTIIIRLRHLVALLGDVHTSLNSTTSRYPFRLYPINFSYRPDGIIVTSVINQPQRTNRGVVHYGHAIGTKLTHIGGLEIEQVKQRLLSIISTENEYWPTYVYPGLLNVPEVLHALGIIPDMESVTFTVEDETQQSHQLVLKPYTPDPSAPLSFFSFPGVRRWTQPLFFTRPASLLYWYAHLPDRQAVYFRYRRCQEMTTQSFASFTQELLEFIEANDVQRLIIDLRGNGGGNNQILNPLFIALLSHRLNRTGSLFVLIDNGTVSSAVDHALDFQFRTKAVLVGEPTGSKPNSFGEVLTFTLPHSALTVRYSTKVFTPLPGQNLSAMVPNFLVQFPWSALAAGRDPVLEAALNY